MQNICEILICNGFSKTKPKINECQLTATCTSKLLKLAAVNRQTVLCMGIMKAVIGHWSIQLPICGALMSANVNFVLQVNLCRIVYECVLLVPVYWRLYRVFSTKIETQLATMFHNSVVGLNINCSCSCMPTHAQIHTHTYASLYWYTR